MRRPSPTTTFANRSVALTLLDRLKKGHERINADAREAISWLDEITEQTNRVSLEGVDEAFTTWEEVEQFLLPETLLSIEDAESEDDDVEYHEDLDSSFAQLDVSDGTSLSSSHSLDEPPKTPSSTSAFSAGSPNVSTVESYRNNNVAPSIESPDRTARNSAEIQRAQKSPRGAVPEDLQPLFNHILWRIHKETNPDAALENFILLTNDPKKQLIAQKFGVRAKRLEQLRDAIVREDREVRNHLTVLKMENDQPKPRAFAGKTSTEQLASERPKSSHSKNEVDSEEEDIVLLKRAPRGPQAQTTNSQRVWDPNEFGRVNNHHGPHHGGRGGRGGFGGPRGRGGFPRGRGGFAPRGGAYVPPNQPFRPPPAPRTETVDPSQPIDPDSFARPSPRANTMRGTRRRLWEPN